MPGRSEAEVLAIEGFCGSPSAATYVPVFRLMVPQLVSYFRVRGAGTETAEDLSQDVMLKVYRQAHQLRDRNLFRPWLFRIARNTLMEERRQKRLPMEPDAEMSTLASRAVDPLAPAVLAQQLSALNEDEREVILLRYIDGFEYHEIAEMLSIPQGTVQWRVFQSRKKLTGQKS